jgi:hypothetical protein
VGLIQVPKVLRGTALWGADAKRPRRVGSRRGQFGLEKARAGAEGANDRRDSAKLNLISADSLESARRPRDKKKA